MSDKNHKILNLIDNIKTKITDQEYIDIVNQLNDEEKKKTNEQGKYLVTGFYSILEDAERESNTGNDIVKNVVLRNINTPIFLKFSERQYEFHKEQIECHGFTRLSSVNDFEDSFKAGIFNQGECECEDCDNPATQDIFIRYGAFCATKITPLEN